MIPISLLGLLSITALLLRLAQIWLIGTQTVWFVCPLTCPHLGTLPYNKIFQALNVPPIVLELAFFLKSCGHC